MDKSILGRLSPELRNRIYELALFEQRPVSVSKNSWIEPALLRTCKQIREEAELLFYSTNDFTCVTNFQDENARCLVRWLKRGRSQKVPLIKSLTIRVEMPGLKPFDFQEMNKNDPYYGVIRRCVQIELQNCVFRDRHLAEVVRVTFNGQSDDCPLEELGQVPEAFWHIAASTFMLEVVFGERAMEVARSNDIDDLVEGFSRLQSEMRQIRRRISQG